MGGKCRIKIVLSGFRNGADDAIATVVGLNIGSSINDGSPIIDEFDSDATIRDVRDHVFHPTWDQSIISVWDCTLHPPRDISKWLFVDYPDQTGPKSKTLFEAGCYPSATWHILPCGVQPRIQSIVEDVQYAENNVKVTESSSALPTPPKVSLVGLHENDKILPSQIIDFVSNRFSNDVDDTDDAAKLLIRRRILAEQHAKERTRNSKLEERIQKLKSIQSKSSMQVRFMLIKSRCTGPKTLKLQDRVHLHITVMISDTLSEHYCFFSRQDTIAKVISKFAPKGQQLEAEFLITNSKNNYRKVPVKLRLYEVMEYDYLKDADSVVIRCFSPLEEHPTTSIVEDQLQGSTEDLNFKRLQYSIANNANDALSETEQEPKTLQANLSNVDESSPHTIVMCSNSEFVVSPELTDRLKSAIEELDKTSKVKKSSAAIKVREMMMKSKAHGDCKRTPKMENRFFLELVMVKPDSISSSFIYGSRMDTIERVMTEHVQLSCPVFVRSVDGSFLVLPMEQSLHDLQDRKLVHCFDRIFIVHTK